MRRLPIALLVFAATALLLAAPAQADFGLDEFDVTYTNQDGSTASQAGAHPYEMTTTLHLNSEATEEGGELLDAAPKDIVVAQIPGFIGNPTAVPPCQSADFLTVFLNKADEGAPACPDSAAIGFASATLSNNIAAGAFYGAVYNLVPPPGKAAKIGFWIAGVPVPIELSVEDSFPYRVTGGPTNISQVLEVVAADLTLWGVPADPAHDALRGHCFDPVTATSFGICPSGLSPRPFLTLPRACEGPLKTEYEADPWLDPGAWVKGFAETHDSEGKPDGMHGCGRLGFGPDVAANPTTTSAESSSGLEFEIDVADEGLENPSYEALADADIEKLVTVLPAGVTANPSAAEGLGVCSKQQFESAALDVQGCPDASKLGTIEAQTPLLENHTLHGEVYLAQQDDPSTQAKGAENPFDSLLALYIVVRDPERGIFVKLATKVEPDPKTGRLTASVEDLPPFPLSNVSLQLRAGPRAPLVTPPTCGTYETRTLLTPSSDAADLERTSSFTIDSGPNGSPCPSGAPPFSPGFAAGSLNNAAGSYSPFAMRLTRADGEQDLTKFSATLPPGVIGKLAGISTCPDASIASARTKTGRAEQASPSCPASSRIGGVLAGAGVGSALTYVPGELYLAGPLNGAPLSVAAIVPAVAGPFDVGTVVTRVALRIDSRTAKVTVDGNSSDPLPHILAGIPLKVRDIRVSADREQFTLNPTSCDVSTSAAQIFGGSLDVFSSADDVPVARSARYQASSCASLGFRPKLSLKLKGGAKRGAHPALTGTYQPRGGDSNLSDLVLRLPRSAFLDQAHIRTICTRVQFAAKACPAAAIYGKATAWTPLLDQPLTGPVYLRSSDHNLPDFVADLHGLVDVEASARIDSVRGGIRATFSDLPDAPLTKVVVQMQGARKGLIVNSRDLCSKVAKANALFGAQNGKQARTKPVMRAQCGGKRKRG